MKKELNDITIDGKPIKLFKRPFYDSEHEFIYVKAYSISDNCYLNYFPMTHDTEFNKLLEKNEILVQSWGENSDIINDLVQTEYFQDTGKRIKISEFSTAQVWKLLKDIEEEF